MRIDRLDLERYGHFEDRSLTFPRDKRVVVVHGANEAGKSTFPAAAVDLLFGFRPRSQWSYRHGNRAMSIAALLSAPDGSTLAVRRLKRQAKNARRSCERPAAAGRLTRAALEGAATGAAFLDGFALDRARLRAAGRSSPEGRPVTSRMPWSPRPRASARCSRRATASSRRRRPFTTTTGSRPAPNYRRRSPRGTQPERHSARRKCAPTRSNA